MRRFKKALLSVFLSFSAVNANSFSWMSPYAYCAGNPVMYVDPDGRDWYQNNTTQYYTWFNCDEELKGFTHIGEKGSLLGEF